MRLTIRSHTMASLRFGDVALEARGVAVEVGGRRVLTDVSLDVRAGEVLAIVGPNGAGKSSLLGVLAGDRPAAAGRVRLGDVDVSVMAPVDLARLRGVMVQHASVAFPFTVREVVTMGRAPWMGIESPDADELVVDASLALADVVDLAGRAVTALSGGEQARVAFARLLAQSTPILLLDEPTASLDLGHQQLVMTTLRQRARDGAAVAVVLHDLNLAAAHADRIAVLAEGGLAALGPPVDVLTSDCLTRVYAHPVDVVRPTASSSLVVLPRRSV
jgi:iron complex transport system ATP-binding protein